VFCIYLRTNSDFCPIYHKVIGFITEMKSVYCAIRSGSLNKAVIASSLNGYWYVYSDCEPLARFRRRLEDGATINLKEVEWEVMDWIDLARIQE